MVQRVRGRSGRGHWPPQKPGVGVHWRVVLGPDGRGVSSRGGPPPVGEWIYHRASNAQGMGVVHDVAGPRVERFILCVV